MSTLRFVHTADLHLDSPFRGLGRRTSPAIARALVDATFDAFDRIADLCLEERVDGLLVAGDIHDAADRSVRSTARFHRRICELAEAGIASFIVHGNHDPLSETSDLVWPELAHVFSGELEEVPLRARGAVVATVTGISYTHRDVTENLARRFVRSPSSPYAIGLLHANAGASRGHANYAPCSLDDLILSRFDYWALGHVHAPQVLRERDPTVVYAGTPQGLTRADLGPRGCFLVEVDGGRASLEFVETGGIRRESIEVSTTGERPLVEALRQGISSVIERAGRSLVVRVRVSGAEARSLGDWSGAELIPVIEDLEEALSTPDRFVLIESVEAVPRRSDPPAVADDEPSLVGELRRLIGEVRTGGADRGLYRDALRPLVLELAAGRCGDPPRDDELGDLLDRAAFLAEDLLREERA
jgi:DNA repair exonuclease SbcCD nuclease subunit